MESLFTKIFLDTKARSFVFVFAILFVLGCGKEIIWNPTWENTSAEKLEGKIVTDWNDMFLILSKTTDGYRAPIAARVLAYMNWSAYEAVAPGMEEHISIAKNFSAIQLPNLEKGQTYHWGMSANEAYYQAIINYVPLMSSQNRKKVDSLHDFHSKRFQFVSDTGAFNRSQRFGKAAAMSILAYADTDGGAKMYLNNKPTDYIPIAGPSKWRRTFPDYLYALTPYLPSVRPILASVEVGEFIPPAAYRVDSSSQFFQGAMEVYLASKNITPTERWIAEFWSDDIQYFTFDTASRWISIANQILKKRHSNLEEAVSTNTQVGIALFDSAVACWKEKYYYKLLRPVTYIQLYIDPLWRTNLDDKVKTEGDNVGITPAHPSYPSGHSTFGEAASIVLTKIFGKEFAFTDESHLGRTDFLSTPRSFKSFEEMSKENAYSRIPLGVHYRMDCDEGLRIGKMIGEQVNNSKWTKSLIF